MNFSTADLYDKYEESLQIARPIFNDYGGKKAFFGPMATVKVYEDNSLVKEALAEPGEGKVLIVDGGASLRCALAGDRLAQMGQENGWAGLIVYGCIRDSHIIAALDIGLKALNTNPRKSVKQGRGERDIPLYFADVCFAPGHHVYADRDGIALSSVRLELA